MPNKTDERDVAALGDRCAEAAEALYLALDAIAPDAVVFSMPKIVKSAPPVGAPLTCEHGTWTRPHVIRCMRCFPDGAEP